MIGIILIINFSCTSHYKTCWHCLKCKKDTENVDKDKKQNNFIIKIKN